MVRAEALDSWQQVSRDFGLLVKKATMVQGSSYRLRLLSEWYGGSLGSLVRTRDQLWPRYLSRMGLASALTAFTKGWDEVQFNKQGDRGPLGGCCESTSGSSWRLR